MFKFMGGSKSVMALRLRSAFVMFAACTPRTRLTETEGQALDNIAPCPISHADQLL
jgi:hypothetical protein